jgi:hypothetical protein
MVSTLLEGEFLFVEPRIASDISSLLVEFNLTGLAPDVKESPTE